MEWRFSLTVTHPERVLKVTDLPQAFYSLEEFQRVRPAEVNDDVKANAMRHMMPKAILDPAGLQPQSRNSQKFGTTCCSRRGSELVYTWEVCASRQRNLVRHV